MAWMAKGASEKRSQATPPRAASQREEVQEVRSSVAESQLAQGKRANSGKRAPCEVQTKSVQRKREKRRLFFTFRSLVEQGFSYASSMQKK